jgi:hypothetical protein
MVNEDNIEVGGRYNWKYQPERLIYLGTNFDMSGVWHQFALVEKPNRVWCEVKGSDLHAIEKTVTLKVQIQQEK